MPVRGSTPARNYKNVPICFAALIANRCETIDRMETHGTPGTLMEKSDLRQLERGG